MDFEEHKKAGDQKNASIWSRSFIILFFANLAFNMGLNMSNSILSLFADHLGASAAIIGLILSSFGITSVLFRLISAPIMDTYNRKYIVIIAALLMSAAFGGFSISKNITMLICFRLLQGCSMAFGNACCLAMVADLLPKDKYSSGLGYYSLAQVICSAVAPYIGIELVNHTSYQITYLLAASFMLCATLLTFLLKSDFTRTRNLKFSLNSIIAKEALLPAGFHFLMMLAGACVPSFIYLFAREQGVAGNVGLYFTVSAVTMLITRPVVGKLTDRFGLLKVSIPAVICTVISLIMVSYATSLMVFLVAAFISAFGQGAFSPAIQALTMKAVPNERRGAASSTSFIAQDVGAMLSVMLAGQLVEQSGYVAMWRIMAIPYIMGMLVLIIFRKTIAKIETDFASR